MIKKVLKIMAIILLVLTLLIAGAVFWIFHSLKTELGDHWKDYANAFTMQTAASKDLPTLENIEQYRVDAQFINKEGNVESRPIQLYVPENVSRPMPLFTLCGPTESFGSHSASNGTGIHDDTPYLEAMFEQGLAQNEVLTSGKLLLLLKRYMGESIQLPAYKGVDDTVYGSLAVYRQEIVEELTCWVSNHSLEELDAAVMEAFPVWIMNRRKASI